MSDLLTFLGLKTKIEYHLKMSMVSFVNEMNNRIEKSSLSLFETYFESIFILRNRSNNLLMGFVKDDKFNLRRNYSARNFIKHSFITAKGLIKQKSDVLRINIEIKPSNSIIIGKIIHMFVFFIIALAFLNIGNSGEAYYKMSLITSLIGIVPFLKMIYDTASLNRIIKNEIDAIITVHNSLCS